MNFKKNIFSFFGLIFQAASLVLCFFPVIFRIVVYECNPYVDCTSFEDSFTKTGETFAFNIFFNPEKFFAYKNVTVSADAFQQTFAILFIIFSAMTLALGIFSFFDKKISYTAAVSAFLTFISFFAQAFKVCFYSFMHLTWKYNGDFAYGCRVILALQLLAAILFLLNGIIKFKKKAEKSDNISSEA